MPMPFVYVSLAKIQYRDRDGYRKNNHDFEPKFWNKFVKLINLKCMQLSYRSIPLVIFTLLKKSFSLPLYLHT